MDRLTLRSENNRAWIECPHCQSVGYAGEMFCACCGEAMRTPQEHHCPSCRQEIVHSIANFCPHCGEELMKSDRSSSPT